jgi:hypothetical protein
MYELILSVSIVFGTLPKLLLDYVLSKTLLRYLNSCAIEIVIHVKSLTSRVDNSIYTGSNTIGRRSGEFAQSVDFSHSQSIPAHSVVASAVYSEVAPIPVTVT